MSYLKVQEYLMLSTEAQVSAINPVRVINPITETKVSFFKYELAHNRQSYKMSN